jgi:hypothetical protein
MNYLDPSGLYAVYLRKSRKDVEMEALGHGETLSRHEQALGDLAARLGIRVAQTYREIVSGDTIAERPEVRRLLDDVTSVAYWYQAKPLTKQYPLPSLEDMLLDS